MKVHKFFKSSWGKKTFTNQFDKKEINGDLVIIDYSTKLMWHQSGTTKGMTFKKAKRWIGLLNNQGYAGYHDWRLPTIEEGASLLESKISVEGLYIDLSFSKRQRMIWTGDQYSSSSAWLINFSECSVQDSRISRRPFNHFRVVRSMN